MSPDPEVRGPGRDAFGELDALKKVVQGLARDLAHLKALFGELQQDNPEFGKLKLTPDGEIAQQQTTKASGHRAQLDELSVAVSKMEGAIAKLVRAKSSRAPAKRRVPLTADGAYRSFRAVRDNTQSQHDADASYALFNKCRGQ